MASDEQRARRRAQREVARNVRAGRKTLPSSLKGGVKRGRVGYLGDVKSGKVDLSKASSQEKRSLAREAALDAVGKGSTPGGAPAAWQALWYHDKDHWDATTHEYVDDYEDTESDSDADYDES